MKFLVVVRIAIDALCNDEWTICVRLMYDWRRNNFSFSISANLCHQVALVERIENNVNCFFSALTSMLLLFLFLFFLCCFLLFTYVFHQNKRGIRQELSNSVAPSRKLSTLFRTKAA